MSRPAGRRNADFEESRRELLDRVVHAVSTNPEASSFAELAEASGVSRATLRHYFPTRDALLHAMLEHLRVLSDRAGAAFPVSPLLSLEEALRLSLHRLVFGWGVGVGSLFTSGLLWGLTKAELGPVYVANMLEPILTSFEGHIASRLDAAGLAEVDARQAALSLVSPVVLALMHQQSLHGVKCRPLDVDAFVETHLQRFLAGWFPKLAR